jgi:catechol 2,3-dioxygenase-like lactoylglutathione lyase family enzyme
MPLLDIHHVALKCKPGKLEATEKFYADFLGMTYAPRPDLGFPGAWLNISDTMFHLVEKEDPEELDPWYKRTESASSVDHIAVKAHGFDNMKQQAIDGGIDWRQMSLPSAGLWQLFFLDPNGVIIELNFPIADEPAGSVGPGTDKLYPPLEEQSKEAQERTKSQAAE